MAREGYTSLGDPINKVQDTSAAEKPKPVVPVLSYGRPMPVDRQRQRLRIDEQNPQGLWALALALVASALVTWLLLYPDFPAACLVVVVAVPCGVAAFLFTLMAVFSRDGLTHAAWLALALILLDAAMLIFRLGYL